MGLARGVGDHEVGGASLRGRVDVIVVLAAISAPDDQPLAAKRQVDRRAAGDRRRGFGLADFEVGDAACGVDGDLQLPRAAFGGEAKRALVLARRERRDAGEPSAFGEHRLEHRPQVGERRGALELG
jgi:hypothetical protein